jgi:hypothetical protein
MLTRTLNDRLDPRDWKRPWRDPPGFFIPGCFCCAGGGSPTGYYTTFGGTKFGGTALQDTLQYQIDAWTAKTDMPANTRYSACAENVGGMAYVMLGTSDASPYWLTSAISYTPDTWTTKASNSAARQQGSSFSVDSAAFYVAGIEGSTFTEKSDVYKYDPSADSWSTKTSLTQAEYDQFGFSSASYGYAVAGFHVSSYLNKTYQYDPTGDSWATRTNATTTRSTGSRGMFLSGLGYCAGGITTGGAVNTNEAYDESTNSWTGKTGMTYGRYYMGAGEASSSTGYATGGQTNTDPRSQYHEEFTPNAWTTRASLTIQRQTNFSARA